MLTVAVMEAVLRLPARSTTVFGLTVIVTGPSELLCGVMVTDIVDPVGSGWRRDLCRSGLSDVDQVKLGDFFGESDSDGESDVFHNRWYTGNLLNLWKDGVEVDGSGIGSGAAIAGGVCRRLLR